MSKGDGWLSRIARVRGWLNPRVDASLGYRQRKGRQGRARLHVALTLTLIAGVSAFGADRVYAAITSSTANEGNSMQTGTVAITDNDGGSAMLSLDSAPLGASDSSCIKTTYTGSLPSEVRHYASATGALAPYLSLKVMRGTGANTFDNCSDFTADSANYFGKGAGVIYDGKLSNYPSSWAAGIVDPGSEGQYSSTVGATPGLVGYWRLGDNAVSADEFGDSTGTVLSNHTDSLTDSWVLYPGQARTAVITNENRIRRETGTGAAQYYTSATPSSADYIVEADLHVKSLMTGGSADAGDAAGIFGRMDIGNTNGLGTNYLARYHVGYGEWQLRKHVDGVATGLGSYPQALTPGQTYRLTLEVNGSAIRLYVDAVQRISVIDTGISATGRGGVRFGQANSSPEPTDTTGLHLDNFRITTLSTTAADSKGANTGTYVGGVRLNEPGATSGDSDRAVHFNGTSGRVEVPSKAALQLTGSLSIEGWIKLDAAVGTRFVLQKGTLYYLYLIGSDVVFGYWSGGTYRYVIAPGIASTGSWQHFVGTYNGSMVRIYRNGVEVASSAQSGGIPTNSTNLSIGNLSATESGSFTGTIDEVALYNTALSAADVSAHYAAGLAEIWSNPENHAYKFQITIDDNAAGLGESATATFNWEARNL